MPRMAEVKPGREFVQLLRQRGLVRLLLPALVARIPDSIAATAIVILVRCPTGSYATPGLAAGAFGIGTAVSAPLTGRALDRFGQRRVMPLLAAAFCAALTALALVAGHQAAAGLLALAAAAGLTRAPIEAGLRALWPRVVPASRLDAAYALDSTLQELIWIGGPLLLRIATTNICGSDLHMFEGRTDVEEGKVLGHENMGEVIEVGSGVDRIKVGDMVCLPFNIGCGFCKNCEAGRTGFCLTANPGNAGSAARRGPGLRGGPAGRSAQARRGAGRHPRQ
jgi:Alcohol dehydrogenase GroES-like domain/Major Facilitator Superfamily